MVIFTRLEGEHYHRLLAHDGEKQGLVDFPEEYFCEFSYRSGTPQQRIPRSCGVNSI